MAEIARRLDVPHSTIRNYSKGRIPSAQIILKIMNETNVSSDWLLTGDGDPAYIDPSLQTDEILNNTYAMFHGFDKILEKSPEEIELFKKQLELVIIEAQRLIKKAEIKEYESHNEEGEA